MASRMTQSAREAFLAELHVGIISIPETGRGPLTVPVWYMYHPGGEVHIWTGSDSRKAQLLRQAERFSLCVQHEQRPYKYVSVEGPIVALDPIDLERDLRPLVYRYLGREDGERYLARLGGDTAGEGDLLVRMRPERWLAWDEALEGGIT